MEDCIYCSAVGICGGGCVFNVEIQEGDINSLDKSFCVHIIKTLNWLLEESVKEELEINDVFIRDISFRFVY